MSSEFHGLILYIVTSPLTWSPGSIPRHALVASIAPPFCDDWLESPDEGTPYSGAVHAGCFAID